MIYILAGLYLLFSCPIIAVLAIWIYERGIRTQMRLEQRIEPAPIRSPVAILEQRREAKEIKQANDRIAEGMANIFGYTGDPQKEKL